MNKLGKFAAACAAVSCAFGAMAETSRGYVHDGLVAMWDGHENAGIGQHRAEATKWVDLVGGVEIDLPAWVAVEDHSLYSTGGISHVATKVTSIEGLSSSDAAWTIEIVQQGCGWTSTDNYNNLQHILWSPRGSLGYRQNNAKGFYFFGPSSATACSLQNWVHASAQVADLHTMSAVVGKDKSTCAIWMDGAADKVDYNGGYSDNNPAAFSFFGNARMSIRVYAVRIYNRALSQEEISVNRALDVIRFVNGVYSGADGLYVSGTPDAYGEVTPAYGAHDGYVAGQSHTFAAPAAWTNAEETVAATSIGYKVYTNGVVYVEGNGNTFAYTHPDCETGAELVWQWALEYKVTVAADAGATVTDPVRWVAQGGSVEFPIECDSEHAVASVSGGVYRDGKIVVENVTAPVEVTVTLGDVWFVATDGDDTADGRSKDTAFATVTNALAHAQTGDTVYLSEGAYTNDVTLTIDKAIALVGAGIDKTVLSPSAELIQGIKMTAAGRISKLTLTGFSTHDTGSALYMSAGTADTIRVTANWQRYISGVSSLNNCAGVYLKNGALLNSSIDHNQAKTGYGGTQGVGIYMENGLVENCDVADNSRNSGEFYGAGIRTSGGTIRNCRILRNVSGGGHDTNNTRGMGLYIVGNATVEDCLIVSNGLNAVWMNNGTVRNCLIVGSKTTATGYTAGVDMSNGTLQNCTIWGNTANNAFSGLRMTGGTAVNNIVFGNGTLGSAVVSGGTFNTNIVDAASAVTTSKAVGNMKADPLLADPEDGDFSLDFASPALDAAAPITAIAHDLAGVTRPQGTAPDIGCYELIQEGGTLKCAIVVGQVDWKAGTAPTATARVLGASGEVTYSWYVDGVLRSDLEGPAPFFTDLSAGRHAIKLAVSDGVGSAEYTFENAFNLHPTEVWVAEDGGDAYPYASPETAAKSLNDAVAAVWSDESSVAIVHIGEGTFYLDAELNLSTPYELRGMRRDKTIVNGCRLSNAFRAAKLGNAKSVLRDLMVTGCTNEVDGSGIYMTAGTLDNVWVYRNQDHKYNLKNGAGIYMTGGTVTNSLIELNSVNSGYGGTRGVGIYMTGGTVVDSVIKDNFRNHGELNGVGVAMCGAGKLIRCVISGNNTMGGGNNASNTRGIGLFMDGNGTVENCLIVSNGIHAVQMSNGTLRNCIIYGHETTSANYTAGIEQSNGTVENCTVVSNVANNAFSGLRMTGGTMVNTIVHGNGESGCALVSGGTFKNNIVDDKSVITTATASDNIVSNPKLKDPANGDFTIGFDSPAVDKGQARAGYAIDFAGTERPQGEAWDIGAYEYAPSGEELNCAIIIGTTQWRGDQRPTAQARVIGGSGNYTYEWYVDGVLSSEDSAEPSFAGLACGTHALKLVVSDGTRTAEDENLTAFTLLPGEVWVDEKGNDTFPYDTSEKAAHSVNAAFAAVWSKADSTGVVHIAAGTYPVASTLTMTTPYKLLGAGRDVTTLVGPDLVKGTRMITMSAAGSEVRDMSLSGCTNQVENGVVVRMTSGWLENVRIHHNYEGYYGINNGLYPGLGISMTGGTVTNCLVDSNRCPNGYGGMAGIGISISGGLVVDSVIRDNGRPSGESHAMGVQMTGGTLRRCVISGNTTDGAGDKDDRCHGVGLGVEGGSPLIENCVIVSNGHSAVTLGNGTMRNCLVTGHKASRANLPAGVNATDGSGKLINCTLAGNTNTVSETWVDLRMTAGTMKNTIAVAAAVTGGTVDPDINCFNEPVAFKRPAKGDFRLTADALNCIDKGDNKVWDGIADPKDLNGDPRIYRNKTVDLGCYEYRSVGMLLIVR